MSNQVLARKFRPKNFAEMVGQQHVVTALTNAISQNDYITAMPLLELEELGKPL